MSATAEKQEIIEAPKFTVAEYNEFAAQMQELREHNKSVFFNYEDPKGNKEARSHVYKLRQTKSAIDKVRKAAGENARQLLKDINDQGNALIAEVGEMIDHHEQHIKAVEEKENARVDAIKTRIAAIAVYKECRGHDSKETSAAIAELEAMTIDESFAEFMAEATTVYREALESQKAQRDAALKQEEEAAELERLRKEAAEREQREREERIAREAEERARKEAAEAAEKERQRIERERIAAEERAKAEREAAERRERELKEQAERAERERIDAEKRAAQEKAASAARAEREKQEAIEAERRRQEQEAAEKAAEEAKREADHKHQAAIHQAIIVAVQETAGIEERHAKALIGAIRAGSVPHVKINY